MVDQTRVGYSSYYQARIDMFISNTLKSGVVKFLEDSKHNPFCDKNTILSIDDTYRDGYVIDVWYSIVPEGKLTNLIYK